MVFRADVSVVQEVFADLLEKKQTLQFRLDILNIGNLINKSWGGSQRFVSNQPLIVSSTAQADAQGKAQYTMRNFSGKLMTTSFEKTSLLSDVYSLQLSVKYFFN
jgi:hypothetical protein